MKRFIHSVSLNFEIESNEKLVPSNEILEKLKKIVSEWDQTYPEICSVEIFDTIDNNEDN